jgi:hypothetical protein
MLRILTAMLLVSGGAAMLYVTMCLHAVML